MEKLLSSLSKLPMKALEWWNKFSTKQKTVIVCVAAGVVLLFSVLTVFLTRDQYKVLITAETTKEAAKVKELLDENSLTYKVSADGKQVSILTTQESDANLVLGANDIPTQGYSIDNVVEGGFTTTESDKQKKYKLYLENLIERDLETNDAIRTANVQLSIPQDDGTLIAKNEDSFASVILELDGEFTTDAATAVARFIATALGNENSENITIIDTAGNLLFSGEDELSVSGTAGSQLGAKQQAEAIVKSEIKSVLLGTDLYDNIEVASNLVLDFSTYEKTQHDYTPAEGQTQGVLSQEDLYQSDATGGVAGEPGTASNDETTYVVEDQTTSTETVTEESRKYLPNESIVNQKIPAGLLKYDESSISVTAKKIKLYKEDEVKDQGLLVDTTWKEFQVANSEQKKLEVDGEIVSIVSKATGITEENIKIVAYETPVFVDSEGIAVDFGDVIAIVLIVVILGLLAFVVFRSMRSSSEQLSEEELSVESLLQSTPQIEVENIEFDDKSETRKMIEKFVDEKPDAAANLLRNWLTEDWG